MSVSRFPGSRGHRKAPCELPICCAATDSIVAIIKHPKMATPATMIDPASILPPCALAVMEWPEKLRYAERSNRQRRTPMVRHRTSHGFPRRIVLPQTTDNGGAAEQTSSH